jgi:hypothetical protein
MQKDHTTYHSLVATMVLVAVLACVVGLGSFSAWGSDAASSEGSGGAISGLSLLPGVAASTLTREIGRVGVASIGLASRRSSGAAALQAISGATGIPTSHPASRVVLRI